MKKRDGFTVIEIIVVVIFLCIIATVAFFQRMDIKAQQRDTQRKTAINAMYYNLEEVFYKDHGYYPEKIGEDNLKAMEPNLLTDPSGKNVGDKDSEYRYEPTDCQNDKCKSYTLRAKMEKEADYTKKSRN